MRRAVLASLLVCARIGADDCEQSGTLTFAYFAVGQRTLTKARRSAVSAKRAHAGRAQTLLLTDRRGVAAATAEARACAASAAAGPAFDDVLELAEAENATAFAAMPEFVAFRTFVTANKLQSRHAAWTDRDNFNNRAVSDLRLAKIRSLEAALKRSRASAAHDDPPAVTTPSCDLSHPNPGAEVDAKQLTTGSTALARSSRSPCAVSYTHLTLPTKA